MQGIIKEFNSSDGSGTILNDQAVEINFVENSYKDSIFSWFRTGQRVIFETDENNVATNMRTGGEIDTSLINAKV